MGTEDAVIYIHRDAGVPNPVEDGVTTLSPSKFGELKSASCAYCSYEDFWLPFVIRIRLESFPLHMLNCQPVRHRLNSLRPRAVHWIIMKDFIVLRRRTLEEISADTFSPSLEEAIGLVASPPLTTFHGMRTDAFSPSRM